MEDDNKQVRITEWRVIPDLGHVDSQVPTASSGGVLCVDRVAGELGHRRFFYIPLECAQVICR